MTTKHLTVFKAYSTRNSSWRLVVDGARIGRPSLGEVLELLINQAAFTHADEYEVTYVRKSESKSPLVTQRTFNSSEDAIEGIRNMIDELP